MKRIKTLGLVGAWLACAIVCAGMLFLSGCSCAFQPGGASDQAIDEEQGGQVQVPNVVQLDEADALRLIADIGLTVGDPTYEYSDTLEKGLVISQEPKALTSVERGSRVEIVVSSGARELEQVSVPDVVGMSQKDAEEVLRKVGLVSKLGNPIVSTKVEPGKVCQQSIEAGKEVSEGSEVVILTALADADVKVPDVKNLPGADAANELSKVGLGVETSSVNDDKVERGCVISQSIAAGTKVAKGTVVALKVSLGKKPVAKVAVPDIRDATFEKAVATLDKAGLAYRYSGDDEGTVESVEPAVGTEVDEGSTVTFVLSRVPDKVDVPDVSGMRGDDARNICENAGLKFDYDTGRPERKLVGTDPSAGAIVDEGTVIHAEYAEEVVVPDVSGTTGDEALDALADVGLELDYDVSRPDRVLSGTEPGAGSTVDDGATVKALYHAEVRVPDVSGMEGPDAAEVLQNAGLELDYDVRHPERILSGTDPAAGTTLDEGSIVEATYNPQVQVPDVAGKRGDKAESTLRKVGLDLDYDALDPERKVVGTEPEAGEWVDEGAIVVAVYGEDE